MNQWLTSVNRFTGLFPALLTRAGSDGSGWKLLPWSLPVAGRFLVLWVLVMMSS